MRFFQIFTGLFLGIGLIALTVGGISAWRSYGLTTKGVTTTGTVIENVAGYTSKSQRGSNTTYRARIRFRLPSGEEVVFVSNAPSNPPAHREGDVVTIVYDPGHPQGAKDKLFWPLWGTSVVAGIMGLAFSWVAIKAYLTRRRAMPA